MERMTVGPRRSLLWVPGDQPRKLEKAAGSGADVVVLDLEDGVAPDRKVEARRCVAAALADIDYGSTERLVRVNASLDPEDLEAAALADGLCLPKVDGPDDLRRLRSIAVAVLGRVPPILAISAESPAGALAWAALAGEADDVVAWMWGSEDLAAALGSRARGPGEGFVGPLELARSATVLLAAATGAQAIDTVYPFFGDHIGLAAEAVAAAEAGFSGKGIIHPGQVGPVHEAFTPDDDAVRRAREVVDAFADGAGVLSLHGQMLDLPHLRAAHRILGRAGLM
jgi:citrate lyase subunit beta/citryl-CoA lyase